MTAYVIRICQNILSRSSRYKEKNQVNVNAEEIVYAEEYWIKKAQASLSAGIAKGSYKSLSPFVDDKGIVRVGGRVDPAVVSYDGQHTAPLSLGHSVSVLVTRNAHQAGHPGIVTTIAKVKRKYWVVKGNKTSKVSSSSVRSAGRCKSGDSAHGQTSKLLSQAFLSPFKYTS